MTLGREIPFTDQRGMHSAAWNGHRQPSANQSSAGIHRAATGFYMGEGTLGGSVWSVVGSRDDYIKAAEFFEQAPFAGGIDAAGSGVCSLSSDTARRAARRSSGL